MTYTPKALCEIRAFFSKTQKEVAEALKYCTRAYVNYENGKTAMPANVCLLFTYLLQQWREESIAKLEEEKKKLNDEFDAKIAMMRDADFTKFGSD